MESTQAQQLAESSRYLYSLTPASYPVAALGRMSGNSPEFEKAAADVRNLKQRPENEELLELYGLFKQATVGDCNTDRPGMFDMKGRAKWDKWNGRKGMSKQDAEAKYIETAQAVVGKYS